MSTDLTKLYFSASLRYFMHLWIIAIFSSCSSVFCLVSVVVLVWFVTLVFAVFILWRLPDPWVIFLLLELHDIVMAARLLGLIIGVLSSGTDALLNADFGEVCMFRESFGVALRNLGRLSCSYELLCLWSALDLIWLILNLELLSILGLWLYLAVRGTELYVMWS